MVEITLTPKQMEVFRVLNDNQHTEIFIGGSAGGGKSFIGCLWVLTSALKYSHTRWFLARARLKSLKESTLLTFFEVCRMCNIVMERDYTYNSVQGMIKFSNGSEIFLRDLFAYPSDPEFVSLGSTEYTGGYIDEMGEITYQAYNIIKSRVRYKLDQYDLIPKVMMGSNPCKTFVYDEFYRKYSNGKLEPFKAYVPMRVFDNPFISDHYIENLKKLDEKNRERLLQGNWEYDNDPSKLFDYDAILDMWTNEHVKPEGKKYLTVDVARFGRDRSVFVVWHGLVAQKVYAFDKTSMEEVKTFIKDICSKNEIPIRNVIIDEDGVGGGVVDSFSTAVGFVNNSKCLPEKDGMPNYSNLKTQCYFIFARLVTENKIYISDGNTQFKDYLVQELEQIKRKDFDKDKKISLVGKDEIKENIGRSPDFADSFMMRMYFEISNNESFVLEDKDGIVL